MGKNALVQWWNRPLVNRNVCQVRIIDKSGIQKSMFYFPGFCSPVCPAVGTVLAGP
jgi:hypothetical protein